MSWTAPQVTRIDEPFVADERTMLEALLEWHRATLLWKCAGLTGEQLVRRSVPPSDLSLLGLVRHMANVERAWFRRRFRGEQLPAVYGREDRPNAAFDEATAAEAEADFARLAEERDLARQAVVGASLDEQFTHERHLDPMSLRWLYGHMIEEYARHNGHADLLRQCVDGATGS
jgi:uncharacterized damage-inducible protein DinB